MSLNKIDVSYQNLVDKTSLLTKITGNENEDTTRLRAIDTILFEVLNWDKNNVETEKYSRAVGYADYVFNIDERPVLVLEAKKTGIDFVLPDKTFENRPYIFGLLAKECPEAYNAMRQAIGYAATMGANYVAISNGHQWLFALTYVQNHPLDKRLIFIFESISALTNKFRLFYRCFSNDCINKNDVKKELLDTLKQPAPPKLSVGISGYPQKANRNIYQNEISYILDFVWQTLSQEEGTPAFIENCYVNPHAHEDILSLVNELVEKRKNEDEILVQYNVESIDKLPHNFASIPAEKPIVILGEVGRGKSSFLKYLRQISAKKALENYIQIEINFLDRPDSVDELTSYVYNEVERQLLEIYNIDIFENNFVRGVLNLDLEKLKKTVKGVSLKEKPEEYEQFELEEIYKIQNDRFLYLTKVIHHLKKGRNHSLAIYFDNLDRRSEVLQEEAFLKASAIARDWASLVFICLRPFTFYKSQKKGVLDTIAPITFTVGQPDLSLVLKRRFAYAKKLADGETIDENLIKSVPSKNIAMYLPSVSVIFESCEFAATKRHGIIPMLEDVSNGNIRKLLELVKSILSSGYLDTKKIHDAIIKRGNYLIPDYEGVKTLLYGDYMQYDPNVSPFINLFDIVNQDCFEHFIRISLLYYLSKIPVTSSNRGYVTKDELSNYLSSLGYNYFIIEETIEYLLENNCIRGQIENVLELSNIEKLRITTLGKYHLFSLVNVFQYIDAIIVDTPILKREIAELMTTGLDINSRIERSIKFIEYIDICSDSINDKEIKEVWDKIKKNILGNIDEIIQKIT